MNWWGASWNAPVCDPERHTDTPVGEPCAWCEEEITADDAGTTMPVAADPPYLIHYHRDCWLRSVIGSVGHQVGLCHCYGGEGTGDPPAMSLRAAATAAVGMFYKLAKEEAGMTSGLHEACSDALREHVLGYNPEIGFICVGMNCDWVGHDLDFPEHQTDVLLELLATRITERQEEEETAEPGRGYLPPSPAG